METNLIIGKNISKYRKSLNMTQLELAEKLNYSDKAISKWERGESVPDINVLIDIANFFNITLNELCYEQITYKSEIANETKKVRHMYIKILSLGLCWLVATRVFAMLLSFAPNLGRSWLTFIYAIPVSGIVLVVLNSLWGKRIYNAIYVSLIIWGVLLCVCLTANTENINWLFLIGIPLEMLTIVWYFFKSKIIEKVKVLRKYRSRNKQKE